MMRGWGRIVLVIVAIHGADENFSLPQLSITGVPCDLCLWGDIALADREISIPGYEFITNCATLDTLLPLQLTDQDEECQLLQSISSYCGCPIPDAEDSCSFCPDGSIVSDEFLAIEVPWLSGAFQGVSPTCGLVEAFASSLSSGDKSCYALQATSTYCGCPALEDHCVYCKGEALDEAYKDIEIPFMGDPQLGVTGTCKMLYLTQYQLRSESRECYYANNVLFHCGCNNGVFPLGGASSIREQAFLVWVQRLSAIIALSGSFAILVFVLYNAERRQGMYHQFMTLIALFDLNTALVLLIGPAAIPVINKETGLPSGVYGAQATEATCRAQAFFFHCGATSIFLNVSLSVYYYLIICKSYGQDQLKKHRMWLFGIPIVGGVGLALASTPYGVGGFTFCTALFLPSKDHIWELAVFAFVPIYGSMIAIFSLIVLNFKKVRSLRPAAQRPSYRYILRSAFTLRRVRADQQVPRVIVLERELLIQCLLYAVSFCLSWSLIPIGFLLGYTYDAFEVPYGFWAFLFFVVPLQGFMNAVIYFRSKWWRRTGRSPQNSNSQGRCRLGCFRIFRRKITHNRRNALDEVVMNDDSRVITSLVKPTSLTGIWNAGTCYNIRWHFHSTPEGKEGGSDTGSTTRRFSAPGRLYTDASLVKETRSATTARLRTTSTCQNSKFVGENTGSSSC